MQQQEELQERLKNAKKCGVMLLQIASCLNELDKLAKTMPAQRGGFTWAFEDEDETPRDNAMHLHRMQELAHDMLEGIEDLWPYEERMAHVYSCACSLQADIQYQRQKIIISEIKDAWSCIRSLAGEYTEYIKMLQDRISKVKSTGQSQRTLEGY